MNTSKIIVRLDAEPGTAELEIVAPHHSPRVERLDLALLQLGIRALHVLELPTYRAYITRLKLVERDGSAFSAARVMQIIGTAQNPDSRCPPWNSGPAA